MRRENNFCVQMQTIPPIQADGIYDKRRGQQ